MRAHILVVLASLGLGALVAVPAVRAQVQGAAPAPYAPPPTAYAPYPTYAPTATYAPYATAYPPPTYSPYATAPPPAPNDAPKQLDYEEGQPIPPGYHLKEKVRVGPVVAGSCTFGVLWLISIFTSTIGTALGDDDVRDLWIPVVGPFITIARVDNNRSTPSLAIDGVGQAVGVGLLVWGISSPKTVLLRNDLAGIEIHATPMVTGKSAGFGLGGMF
jgi:hypothetical protein